jgi:hypothetical protein
MRPEILTTVAADAVLLDFPNADDDLIARGSQSIYDFIALTSPVGVNIG